MWIYLGVFGLSIALTFCGESLRKKKNTAGCAACLILAVLAVAVLAGVRDFTVGTDGDAYRWWVWDAENASSILDVMKQGQGTEPVYRILTYIATRTLGGINGLFFFSALLTYAFVMAALALLRDHIFLPYGWAAYLFLFYSNSLNQLRQALAMTIVLLGITLVMQKKYLPGVLLLVLAVGAHNTAVLGIGMLLVYLILKKWDTLPVRTVMVAGLAGAAAFYQPLFRLLARLGLPISRFASYLETGDVHFSLNPILVRLPFLVLALWLYREFSAEDTEGKGSFTRADADFLLIMMAAELVTAEMRIISVDIYRISLYFGVLRCVLIGRTAQVLARKEENKTFFRLVLAGMMALLVLIWIYQVVLKGNDAIIPYTSTLLHIGTQAAA